MTKPLYLDYAATTPIDPEVIAEMQKYFGPDDMFGNPSSSTHAYGWEALEAIDTAKKQVAALINASEDEIIWTSGATESDNLTLFGAAQFYSRNGKHIITCKTEHKAVLDCTESLAREGYEITYLETNENGLINLDDLKQAIKKETILISIMHVNSEIGVIQNIKGISEIAKKHGALVHTDAAQSVGKIPVDVNDLNVDLMSLSAHKMYGPKGIGALYVRRKPRVRLKPILHGGGQQQGLRPGTLPTHQIAGFGKACDIAKRNLQSESQRILNLRNKLWSLCQTIPETYLNGDLDNRVPGNLSICFGYVDGEALMMDITKDIAVSTSSACTSASIEPSYVLKAIGRNDTLAHSTIRISIGRFTKEEDIDTAFNVIKKAVERLRALSPLWQER